MRIQGIVLVAVLMAPIAYSQVERLDSKTDGTFDKSSCSVSFPSGPSDYFSTRFTGGDPTETLSGIHVSVADFGTTATGFPLVGIYRTNFTLDPTGRTPDLTNAVLSGPGPITTNSHPFDVQVIPLGTAPHESDLHVVAQFPPGDPGLLTIGVDSDSRIDGGDELNGSNPHDSSAFTSTGYTTPGTPYDGLGDFGLGLAIAPGSQFLPALRLSPQDSAGEPTGHYSLETISWGAEGFVLSFWGEDRSPSQTLWLPFISMAGIPLIPIGSPLPSTPVGDGSTTLQVSTTWPQGFGNLTFNFVAVAGSPGLIGSVAVSNEITLHVSACFCSISFGNKDDGTYEGGWVVSGVAGSSDYFSTPWGTAPGSLGSSSYAVMDFGTTFSSYPRSGQAPPNYGLDCTGSTPDLSNPYVDQPLTFPALTFVSTSAQLVHSTFSSYYIPATKVIEFIQFPPGDPALLGVGADTTSTFIDGLAGWTLDGYNTPANLFALGNWGMRTQ